ncbi:MAG: efflux transporter periplasmic adaptor subunit [Cellvibrionaceae bacterium]|nr:efflux transporter periplasmic adaptor subunit [Cellvibrionaceae bacterium]|tara:strand:+ start:1603 stop:2388 length:786 start_codon:yes stop_codon:yes gene_type:complete
MGSKEWSWRQPAVVAAWCLVAVLPAQTLKAQDTSQLSCLLEPSSETKLSSSVSGVVARVAAERGGRVRKGQEVLALESELDKASLKSAKARAEFAARKLERNRRLLEQQLLSDFERDELVTEHQLALLAVGEAQSRLSQRSIKSPIDGVVVKRHVSVGEYVGSDPVMELVSLNPLHAEVIMRATRYGEITEGMAVKVLLNDPAVKSSTAESYEGVVTVVDRVIDAASSTFGFRVKVENSSLALPAGLKCSIEFASTSIAAQ